MMNSRNMRTLAAVLSLFLTLCTVFIQAASANDRERAEELNSEGRELVKQLDLTGAAERFRQALQLANDPRYAFNLCYTLEKSRLFGEAYQACKRVQASSDARLAEKATQLLVEIESELAKQQAAQGPANPGSPTQPTGPWPAAQPGGAPAPAATWQQPAPGYGGPPVQQSLGMPYKRTRTYGWHVFLADAASWTVVLVGAASESPEVTSIGVAGMLFGGPGVHYFHQNSRGALLSVAARLGLPLVGAIAFSAGCSDFDCVGAAAAGGLLGYAGAVALDWWVFAEKDEYVYSQQPLVQPTLNLTRGGALAGFSLRL